MSSSSQGVVQQLLERAHSPDTAAQIFSEKIQFRQLFLRPTSPPPGRTADSAADPLSTALDATAAGATGMDGREARRRSRRIKQEQRLAARRAAKPQPLSSRQRRRMGLYDMPTATQPASKNSSSSRSSGKKTKRLQSGQTYATFEPLHRLWVGYIREILGIDGGDGAQAGATLATAWATSTASTAATAATAAKLTAADFHGAEVEVTRSACVGRVGLRGIVVRDAKFVFEIVTPDNQVKMVPKEGTFFRVEVPLGRLDGVEASADGGGGSESATPASQSKLVFEIIGAQFMHRAADRSNRKFKHHFYTML